MDTLRQLRNKHSGETAFIVCTGPSLDAVDSEYLKDKTLIGMNRGYLKEDFNYRYFCTIDDLVIEQFGSEIANLPVDAVFAGGKLKGDNVINLRWAGNNPFFQRDITQPMWQGHTVTYVAMQVAYYLGFTTVYLIGLDHFTDYSDIEKVSGKKGHVTKGVDPNHFYTPGGYFGKDVRWQHQDKKSVELAYMLARWHYGRDKRRLLNATLGTQLPDIIIPHEYLEGLTK